MWLLRYSPVELYDGDSVGSSFRGTTSDDAAALSQVGGPTVAQGDQTLDVLVFKCQQTFNSSRYVEIGFMSYAWVDEQLLKGEVTRK